LAYRVDLLSFGMTGAGRGACGAAGRREAGAGRAGYRYFPGEELGLLFLGRPAPPTAAGHCAIWPRSAKWIDEGRARAALKREAPARARRLAFADVAWNEESWLTKRYEWLYEGGGLVGRKAGRPAKRWADPLPGRADALRPIAESSPTGIGPRLGATRIKITGPGRLR